MQGGQLERIMEYAKALNQNIDDDELLKTSIVVAVDRLLLYLNDTVLEERLERLVAQMVADGYKQAKAKLTGEAEQPAVKSISDNGQSISYGDAVVSQFTQASDKELFDGYSSILARYRRVNVIA